MLRAVARRVRVERAVGGLRLRDQPDAALQDARVPERVRGDFRLDPRVSPPHGLLAPGAIDERVEQAVALRFARHLPDGSQSLITALERTDILDRRVNLPHRDVPDLQ